MKLNENWMKLVDRRKKRHTRGAYSPYGTDHRVVARDWEISEQVKGLPINEVDAKPWWEPKVKDGVTINADRIQILVLPEGMKTSFALARYAGEEEDEYEPSFFYRVTEDGISQCWWDRHNSLVEVPWSPDPEAQAKVYQIFAIDELLHSLSETQSNASLGIDEAQLPAELQEALDGLYDDTSDLAEQLEEFRKTLIQSPKGKK